MSNRKKEQNESAGQKRVSSRRRTGIFSYISNLKWVSGGTKSKDEDERARESNHVGKEVINYVPRLPEITSSHAISNLNDLDYVLPLLCDCIYGKIPCLYTF